MTNQFAYAPEGTLEFKGSAKKIAQALLRDLDTNWSPQSIQRWTKAARAERGIYDIKVVGTSPGPEHRQSGTTDDGLQPDGSWQETRVFKAIPVEQVRERARQRVRVWKQGTQDSTIKHTINAVEVSFQNDSRSRQFILGAVQLAMINLSEVAADPRVKPFSIEWTMEDDTVVTLDALAMISLGKASAGAVSGSHKLAVEAKRDIAMANDETAVRAVLDRLLPPRVVEANLAADRGKHA